MQIHRSMPIRQMAKQERAMTLQDYLLFLGVDRASNRQDDRTDLVISQFGCILDDIQTELRAIKNRPTNKEERLPTFKMNAKVEM